jgi:hypothetical protein
VADIPSPNPVLNPIGTPFDDPATEDSIGPGQPGATLFSILKGILLQLIALNKGTGE